MIDERLHNEHDFGGPRDQCPFCYAMLLTALAEARAKLEAARDWRKAVEEHRHALVAVEWAMLDAILGGSE